MTRIYTVERAAQSKAWCQANKEKRALTQKAYRNANPEQVKTWRNANKERNTATNKAYREANKERILKTNKTYRDANKEKTAVRAKAWYSANKENSLATGKVWYEANKVKHYAVCKAWRTVNTGLTNALAAKRRSAKLQATPIWANLAKIKAIYDSAARVSKCFDIRFHVDHIVPLQGKKVCGLHVETNMQVLTSVANIRKGNMCT